MRLFPLLRGEVEIETLTLKAPQFRLVEHDASAMAALGDLPVENTDLARPEGEVIVTDARFVYEGAERAAGRLRWRGSAHGGGPRLDGRAADRRASCRDGPAGCARPAR